MTKKLLKILLITCLSACKEPEIADQPQRTIVLNLERDQENGRLYVKEENSICLERMYRYSEKFLGPVSQSVEIPIEQCNKLIGNEPASYVKITNFLEEVRSLIELNR